MILLEQEKSCSGATGSLDEQIISSITYDSTDEWLETEFNIQKSNELAGLRYRAWRCIGYLECIQQTEKYASYSVEQIENELKDPEGYLRVQRALLSDVNGAWHRLDNLQLQCAVSPWHRFDINPQTGNYKKPHVHLVFYFQGKKSMEQVVEIAHKIFGEATPQVAEPADSVPGACRYLCHLDAHEGDGRYVYPIDGDYSYFTFGGFDCASYMTATREQLMMSLRDMLNVIDKQDIREFSDFVDYCNKHDAIMFQRLTDSRTRPFVDNYIRSRRWKKRDAQTIKSDIKQVVYVYGNAGVGKTTFAKRLAQKERMSIFISGSSNDPFEDYDGQEVVVLDDLRPNIFDWSDLLKILDPHTFTLAKARFHNKDMSAVRVIVITSPLSPVDFVEKIRKKGSEDIHQFYRRLAVAIHISKDKIEFIEPATNKVLSTKANDLLADFGSNDEVKADFINRLIHL